MASSMEFDCKLAHLDEVKKISGFNSIKELYERIEALFSIPIDDILFCTLNTNDFKDMDSLIGNYLSYGDLIIVHICGKTKDVSIKKTQEYLGLTITDNGKGRAFIKKINSNGDLSNTIMCPGDHIAAINSESTVGLRHYEVARAIREVPQNSTFTMHLIEPLHSLNYANPINVNHGNRANISILSFNERSNNTSDVSNLNSIYDELANSSLPIERLLSKNSKEPVDRLALTSQDLNKLPPDEYRVTIEKINSILESFLGINDNALAIQIYRLAKDNKDSYQSFIDSIKSSELSLFNFSDEIQSYLWDSVYQVN